MTYVWGDYSKMKKKLALYQRTLYIISGKREYWYSYFSQHRRRPFCHLDPINIILPLISQWPTLSPMSINFTSIIPPPNYTWDNLQWWINLSTGISFECQRKPEHYSRREHMQSHTGSTPGQDPTCVLDLQCQQQHHCSKWRVKGFYNVSKMFFKSIMSLVQWGKSHLWVCLLGMSLDKCLYYSKRT